MQKKAVTGELYGSAVAILKLLMIKRGVLDISDCHASDHDTDVMVYFICTV